MPRQGHQRGRRVRVERQILVQTLQVENQPSSNQGDGRGKQRDKRTDIPRQAATR